MQKRNLGFRIHAIAATISGLIVGLLCLSTAIDVRGATLLGITFFTLLGACLGAGLAYVNMEFALARNIGPLGLLVNQFVTLLVSAGVGIFLTSSILLSIAWGD
jgi:hypothetical protein